LAVNPNGRFFLHAFRSSIRRFNVTVDTLVIWCCLVLSGAVWCVEMLKVGWMMFEFETSEMGLCSFSSSGAPIQ